MADGAVAIHLNSLVYIDREGLWRYVARELDIDDGRFVTKALMAEDRCIANGGTVKDIFNDPSLKLLLPWNTEYMIHLYRMALIRNVYTYPDTHKILGKLSRDNYPIYLIIGRSPDMEDETFDYRYLMVKAVGIHRHSKKVFREGMDIADVVDAVGKILLFEGSEQIYFVDSDLEHHRSVKESFPQARTILKAVDGRAMGDSISRGSKYVDYTATRLDEIYYIIVNGLEKPKAYMI